jgi:hypothetical protein
METNIYQVVSFANAYNKRTKKWESLHNVKKVYINKEGLKSANIDFEEERRNVQFYLQQNLSKYREVRGKVELQVPHIHENGSLAYWGDEVLNSFNPNNI